MQQRAECGTKGFGPGEYATCSFANLCGVSQAGDRARGPILWHLGSFPPYRAPRVLTINGRDVIPCTAVSKTKKTVCGCFFPLSLIYATLPYRRVA